MNLQEFHPTADTTARIAAHIKEILRLMGENPERDGLLKTPERVGEAYQFLTKGYQEDPIAILQSALFEEQCDRMVMVRDIDFYSLCEHHLLPIFGKVHVAYVPDGKITGLSKVARVTDVFARRLQVQERMTRQIAESIQQALSPKGVIVLVEAEHMCMQMRGVQKPHAITTTIEYTGVFTEASYREEFFQMLRTH